jgi:predicted aspartyl protease
MKNLFVYIFILLAFTRCSRKLSEEQGLQLKACYTTKDYFKLDQLMSGITRVEHNPDLLLYKATIENVFNKPGESNRLIQKLLKKYPRHFNDTIMKDLYYMQEANAYRLQDYQSEYIADSILVAKYSPVCDSSEIETHKDDLTLFRVIRDVPKMEIKIPVDATATLKRDIAGLMNVSVTLQKDSIDWVFDTGAAFSVILESQAAKYGVRILPGKIRTGTSTGIKVEGQMGLLDLRVGNIEVKNAVMLVLPDSALTFANGAYVIKGVLGFPVIYALQEFTIKDDKTILVHQTQGKTNDRNLALDGQYMLIRVEANNDTLPFLFDSGNNITNLSARFYNKYKSRIEGKCTRQKVITGGAGGTRETEAYILDSLGMSVGNSNCTLDSLVVYTNDLMGYDVKYLYGNFGQDYVSRFSEMKIDFASMNISFSHLKPNL